MPVAGVAIISKHYAFFPFDGPVAEPARALKYINKNNMFYGSERGVVVCVLRGSAEIFFI